MLCLIRKNILNFRYLIKLFFITLLIVLCTCLRYALYFNADIVNLVYLVNDFSIDNIPVNNFSSVINDGLLFSSLMVYLYLVISIVLVVLENKLNKNYLKNIDIIAFVIMILYLIFAVYNLGFIDFLSSKLLKSSYIEDNYVYKDNIEITNKHNLIYLNIESLENSYKSIDDGGLLPYNLIPNLTKLQSDNYSFYTNDRDGNTQMLSNFTYAAISNIMTGLPFKLEIKTERGVDDAKDAVYRVSLGSFLKKYGYDNYAIMGSNSNFSNKNKFLINNGDYKIYDYIVAKKVGFIDEEYNEGWGMEDKKVFEWSKDLLTEIANKGKPFNVMIETTDLHFPAGVTCSDCELNSEYMFEDIIRCNDKHIYDFVSWVQEQDWYEDTTIVILGDHLYMGIDFYKNHNIKGVKDRTIYNCFINPSNDIKDNDVFSDRNYLTLDMFPTILNSIGFDVDKLALGTNLFSGEKTLVERDGYFYVRNELVKGSDFYFDMLGL